MKGLVKLFIKVILPLLAVLAMFGYVDFERLSEDLEGLLG